MQSAISDIRWGSGGNPLTGLTITWRNTTTANDSIKWGYTATMEKRTFAGVKRIGVPTTDYFFKYVFGTVIPNSTIYYKLFDSKAKTWTTRMVYSTADVNNTTKFSFLGMGDSRTGLSIWNQVATLANSKRADFTIFTGDIVADASISSDWSNWFINGKTYIQNNLIYHCMGNHDASGEVNFKNSFDLPQTNGSSLYYSFTYGNAIFIALNSEDPTNSTQTAWLKNTLQANQNKTWKIIFFHRPFYTIGNHTGEMDSYFNTWWKTFDDYGVDLIVNGHDHMYERSKPINRNVSTTAPVSKYGSNSWEGRCQIVCGGAGAPLYTGSATVFIQKYVSTYNFCKFNIDGYVLCDTTFDNNGAIIETFCIDKTPLSTGGINNNQLFYDLTVFPNPTKNGFKLKYTSPLRGEAFIKIYDIKGKEVASEKVVKTADLLEFEYNLFNYAKGVYSVQVIMGTQKDDALLVLN
ncbi:MAG: metallophosphoesterase [Bacteroidetes bacterium]|nr:metallophosphoesterase [Bacteroidota bacterium]